MLIIGIVTDLDNLRRRLGAMPPQPDSIAGQTSAAVLVPIVTAPGGSYLLLTRRTDAMSTHRGEIAFPGGRLEAGETGLDAALREAQEELAIEPADLDVLGALPGVGTNMSRFWILPWVGTLAPEGRERIVPNPAEVADLLEVPLDTLTDPACRRDQRFINGRRVVVAPAYDTPSGTIWGATARIVEQLLAALQSDPRGAIV